MSQSFKTIADEIMDVRDQLMVKSPETTEEQADLLAIRDRVLAQVDEVGTKQDSPKPRPKAKPKPKQTKVGKAIKEARTSAGMSQDDLAEQATVSLVSLRNIESGATQNPQRKTLERLQGVLDTPLVGPGE